MKILITSQYIDDMVGGAEQSLSTLVHFLSEKHKIKIFNYSREKSSITENIHNWTTPKILKKIHIPKKIKFLLDYYHSIKYLKKLINQFTPDIIISQKPPIPYCFGADCPIIIFVRDLEYITFFVHSKSKTLKGRFNFVIEKFISKKILSKLRCANLVLANSQYVAQKLMEKKINAEFIYPFIRLKDYIVNKREPKYITYISGGFYPHKGFLLFLEIAERMPTQKFLAIGRDPDNLMRFAPKNIEWWGWTRDIRKVYSQTKVLIVPSLWEEPFGRVVIESQVNGIPAVASKIGGLPESVGNGGILIEDYTNPEAWIKTLKKILVSDKLFRKLSLAAIENSKRFDASISYDKFRNIVKEKFGVNL